MVKSLLIAIIGFILFLALHIFVFAIINPINKVNSLLLIFSIVLVFVSIIYWKGLFNSLDQWVENYFKKAKKIIGFGITILLFTLLFIGYLEFYFTVDRSITFRMLIIVDHFQENNLTSDELLSIYNTDEIIRGRISDLRYGGYLNVDNETKLSVTDKGKIILSIYKFALNLLNFDPAEFVKDPNLAKKLF